MFLDFLVLRVRSLETGHVEVLHVHIRREWTGIKTSTNIEKHGIWKIRKFCMLGREVILFLNQPSRHTVRKTDKLANLGAGNSLGRIAQGLAVSAMASFLYAFPLFPVWCCIFRVMASLMMWCVQLLESWSGCLWRHGLQGSVSS